MEPCKALIVSVLILTIPAVMVVSVCPWTGKSGVLPFKIGLLMSKKDVTFPKHFQAFLDKDTALKQCVNIYYVNFDIWHDFKMPVDGWTRIKKEIIEHSIPAHVDLDIVIGPYYHNVAMMLEQLRISYLVTDNKGYDWIDMNRVNDPVQWKTMVELIPPVQEQNRAVVDYFVAKNWDTVVMIMPDDTMGNQECQDMASQMIDSGVSLIPFSISTSSRETSKLIQSVLRTSQLQTQYRIIICSPRDKQDRLIRGVLMEAKRFDLLGKVDHVFVIIEPTSTLHALSGSNFYKLGLHSARADIFAFRFVLPDQDAKGKAGIHQAAANDSGRIVRSAIESFFLDHKDDNHMKLAGDTLVNYMKEVRIQGDTGWIEFNQTGQRTNYTLYLYNHGGEDMFKEIAQWQLSNTSSRANRSGGIIKQGVGSDTSREDTKIGIFPDIVKVVSVLEKPFVMRRGNGFEGFTVDILHRLSEELHFEYEIYESPYNRYGISDEYGQWDGMIGEILHRNATLAMGAISITSQREHVVDFSLGIISTGIDVLITKPKERFTIFQFIKPFSPNLWLAIVGSFLLVSLVYFALDYFYEVRQFTLKETFWFSIGTLMMRGTDFSPHPSSQRILTAGFTFFVLITVSTYTANMAAFLTTTNIEDAVESLEDLADTKDIKVYTVADSATMNFLKRGSKPVYERLWQKTIIVPNSAHAIAKVNNGEGAFVFDYLINQYAEMQECNTRSIASPIMLQEHGIGMPAGAPFKSKIDIALLKLIEKGYISTLRKRWWYDKRKCDTLGKEGKRSTKIQFELKHMAGVFIVGLFGLACSAAFFLFKKFYLLAKPIEVAKE